MKAVVSCICGKAHTVDVPTGSANCSCGRVVLLEKDTRGGARSVRPWCDQNGVDYPANYAAPEITGWVFTKGGKRGR